MKNKKKTKLYHWQQWLKNEGGKCAKCGRTDHLTVDHIIPVSLLGTMQLPSDPAYEDSDNFQVLCRWCNSLKANQLDHLNPKTVPLLKKYVKEYGEIHESYTGSLLPSEDKQ